jgi:AcrR family transcriptional regulator
MTKVRSRRDGERLRECNAANDPRTKLTSRLDCLFLPGYDCAMPKSATAHAPRRTQEERSAATQARLLDAAVDCLVELGFGATTTTVVAERAGVSRGAQLHHFATRAQLVGAAVQHVFAGLTRDYQQGFARVAARTDRVRGAIDLLWSIYLQPRHLAALDLYLAARTDGELRAVLAPIAARHRDNVLALARAYFPEAAASRARFDTVIDLILSTMLGMALSRGLHGDRPADAAVLAEIERLARELTSAPPADDGRRTAPARGARRVARRTARARGARPDQTKD